MAAAQSARRFQKVVDLLAKLAKEGCQGSMCEKVLRARLNDIVNKILPDVRNGTYPNGTYGTE
jgi:hypothetical protein